MLSTALSDVGLEGGQLGTAGMPPARDTSNRYSVQKCGPIPHSTLYFHFGSHTPGWSGEEVVPFPCGTQGAPVQAWLDA